MMAKILGVREIASSWQVPRLLQRAQGVSIMGVGSYEPAGMVERDFTPYDRVALGQAKAGYDLGQPGAVAEVKKVLVALAQYFADPMSNPTDPLTETIWQHIDQSPDYADAWDGPTSDEYVLMISRLRGLKPMSLFWWTDPVYSQLVPVEFSDGKTDIVGGPQPTVPGLELLAQGAHTYLRDSVQLNRYLAWRGGILDCGIVLSTESCTPPQSFVKQTGKSGRAWDPRGWTLAWRDGPAAKSNTQLVPRLDMIEESLRTDWIYAQIMTREQDRTARAESITQSRKDRHDVVLQLNQGAPDPQCSEGFIWSKTKSQCVSRCPDLNTKWDPAIQGCALWIEPPDSDIYKDYDQCVKQHVESGFEQAVAEDLCSQEFPKKAGVYVTAALMSAVVIGFGAWWYFTKGEQRSKVSAGVANWEMKAPED